MVEGMKAFCGPRVKPKVRSPKSNMMAQGVEAKVKTNTSGDKASRGFMTTRRSIVVTYEIRVFFEGAQKEIFSSIF